MEEDQQAHREIEQWLFGRLQFELDWRWAMELHNMRWGVPCGPTLEMTAIQHLHEYCPTCYVVPGVKIICPDPWHLRPTNIWKGINHGN